MQKSMKKIARKKIFFLVSLLFSYYRKSKMVPNKVFFTKGVGVHKERLASFEMALRAAGVAHCNLVLVSSIYPPGCKIISKMEGLNLLRPGEMVFAAAVFINEDNLVAEVAKSPESAAWNNQDSPQRQILKQVSEDHLQTRELRETAADDYKKAAKHPFVRDRAR